MISKDDFLTKYNISDHDFESTRLKWEDLILIYTDFENRKSEFEPTAKDIVERLLQVPNVHSVRYRIKESEHLIEKIIRKKIENVRRTYTLDNYISKIEDIIGVRALHLFKDDWEEIDHFIINTWKIREKPTANIRNGDSEDLIKKYQEKGFKIKIHKYGYRSVHYILESSPTKKTYKTELQVRTIFEEGWSEIDHTIRYPYDLENPILKQYLLMFNRLAGNADEMGTYIKFLQSELEIKEIKHSEKLAEREKQIEELKLKINRLEIDKDTKKEIGISLDTLMSTSKLTTWEMIAGSSKDGVANSYFIDPLDNNSSAVRQYNLAAYEPNILRTGFLDNAILDKNRPHYFADFIDPDIGLNTAYSSKFGSPSYCISCHKLFYSDATYPQTKCNDCRD